MELKERKSLLTGSEFDIYLDNGSTTQVLPEVLESMANALENSWGNPSSAHARGELARSQLHYARDQVARCTGSSSQDVVFTSGATEANNIVLQSLLADQPSEKCLVTTEVEHSSIIPASQYLDCLL